MDGAGKRKLKKVFKPADSTQRVSPIVHIRNVNTGMDGSSTLDTLARTSGYSA